MATTNATVKTCPVTGSFCWKNPLHLVAFFAILPFAIKGGVFVWHALENAVTSLVK
jgi:hypothetical protein